LAEYAVLKVFRTPPQDLDKVIAISPLLDEPLAGHHFRIGAYCPAGRRREND
jgi:hypothetical protein